MADEVVIGSGALTATLSPLGAELRRLQDGEGRDLQWDGDPAWWTGRAPVLFPVIGMLRDGRYRLDGRTYVMPKHGFARRSTFAVAERSAAAAVFRLEADAETRAVYPFAFRLELRYAVEGAALSVEAVVANTGERSLPASLGFHPALRWPLPFGRPREAHQVVFDADEPAPVRRIDGDGLLKPEPESTPLEGRTLTPRDAMFEPDALIFDRVASRRVVYGAPGAPRVAVEFPDSPVLGVWTKPGAPFLCIEPWRGLPDPEGYDGDIYGKPGAFTVPPGASQRVRMRLELLGGAD